MSYYNIVMNFFQDVGEENAIVFHRDFPARKATCDSLNPPLSWRIEEILKKGSLSELYSHQVEAINTIRNGKNTIIVTRTGSGKSLCYNLPVLESIMDDNSVRALYIFPAKALIRNQAARLEKYNHAFYYDDFHIGIYDGDTPKEERPAIRKKANIVITNPDMLHLGILPNHNKWKKLFTGLKYVVMDEIHMYRGIFGAHVAQIIRRLRRICRKYGSDPQFICSSATIANPRLLASKLTRLKFELIDKNTGPSYEKTFLFWDTSLSHEDGLSRSINTEASLLFYHLIAQNVKTVVFTGTRNAAEIILKTTRDLLSGSHSSLINRITSYRAGYTPELRRKIEQQLSSGELIGIVTTSALEVGVDIGSLEACIIVGFPQNIMSAWQQAGRVGRKGSSIVIILASRSPRDHYYLNHGDKFFSPDYENAVVDLRNPYILDGHFRCAAYEYPLEENDEYYFGKSLYPFIKAYSEKNYLFFKENKFYWNVEDYYPAGDFSLRTSCGKIYDIVIYSPPYRVLGTTNVKNINFYFHPDAIYIHHGETYRVMERDEHKKRIYVTPDNALYYTKPQIISEVETKKILRKSSITEELYLAVLRIKEKCVSYREIELATGKSIKTVPLDTEEEIMDTVGFRLSLSENIQKSLRNSGFEVSGGIYGTGHILTSVLSIFTLCTGEETGSISTSFHKDTGKPTIFLYDRFPGGIGYSQKAFEIFPDLINEAYSLIKKCVCEKGCPRCIYSYGSIYPKKYLNKDATLFILENLKKEITGDFIV